MRDCRYVVPGHCVRCDWCFCKCREERVIVKRMIQTYLVSRKPDGNGRDDLTIAHPQKRSDQSIQKPRRRVHGQRGAERHNGRAHSVKTGGRKRHVSENEPPVKKDLKGNTRIHKHRAFNLRYRRSLIENALPCRITTT